MPWKYEYIANADGGGFLKPRSVEVDFGGKEIARFGGKEARK